MSELISETWAAIRQERGREAASWLALVDMLQDEDAEPREILVAQTVSVLARGAADDRYQDQNKCQTACAWLSGDPRERSYLIVELIEVLARKPAVDLSRRDWQSLTQSPTDWHFRQVQKVIRSHTTVGEVSDHDPAFLLDVVQRMALYKLRMR